MSKKKIVKTASALTIAGLLSLILCLLPTGATAQCAGDADCDGFPDALELAGTITPMNSITAYPVDPNKPDLFVIVVPASSSMIPANPFDLYTQTIGAGGMDININQIDVSEAGPDREVTAAQKAAKITEDLSSSLGYLGWCPQGTVNDYDDCVVYTQRILNKITDICGARYPGPSCVGPNGEEGLDLLNFYIKWVMVHEIGHTTTLAADYNKKIGNHYATGSGAIMDQSVQYTDKQGIVTFFIPGAFSSESQVSFDSWADVH